MLTALARIPQSLQPTLMGGGGAITVEEQRLVKKYGSIEAGRKFQAAQKKFTARRKAQVDKLQAELNAARRASGPGATSKAAELQKVLASVKEGNLYSNIDQIVSEIKKYGSEVQRVYEENQRRLKEARQEAKRKALLNWALERKLRMESSTIAPTTISYDEPQLVSQPKVPLYADIEDIQKGTGQIYFDVEKTQPAEILRDVKVDRSKVYIEEAGPAPLIKLEAEKAPTPEIVGERVGLYAPIETLIQYEQDREPFTAYTSPKMEEEIKVEKVPEPNIYLGPSQVREYIAMGGAVEESPFALRAPTTEEVMSLSEERETKDIILGRGSKPKLTGAESAAALYLTYQDKMQKQMQEDFEREYQVVLEKEQQKLDVEKYQKRIDAGEDFEKVSKEYQLANESAKERLQEFQDEYSGKWYTRKGQFLEREARKIQATALTYYQAREQQARIAGFFTTGLVVGGAGAAATTGVIAAAPVLAPVVAGAGLLLYGGMAGYTYGRAIALGEDVYEESIALGMTEKEARQRALVAGTTETLPFAATSAGALIGGLAVGGTIRYARKPILTRKVVAPPKRTIRAYDITGRQTKRGVTYDPQKIAEIGIPGQRTEVTTVWRSALGVKPVTTGVPGTKGYTAGVRLLRGYGYTRAGAEAALRYTPSRMASQYITKGYAYQKDGTVFGRVETKITDPTVSKLTTTDRIFKITEISRGPKTVTFQQTGYDVTKTSYAGGRAVFTEYGYKSGEVGVARTFGPYDVTYGTPERTAPTLFTKAGGFTFKEIPFKPSTTLVGTSFRGTILATSKPTISATVAGKVGAPGPTTTTQVQTSLLDIAPQIPTPTTTVAPTTITAPTQPINIAPLIGVSASQTQEVITRTVQVPQEELIAPRLVSITQPLEDTTVGLVPITTTGTGTGLETFEDVTQDITQTTSTAETTTPAVTSIVFGEGIGGVIPDMTPPGLTPGPGDPGAWTTGFRLPRRKEIEPTTQKVEGYDGFVKYGGKYNKVVQNKPKNVVLDVISRIVDHTTSAEAKYGKTGKKVKKTGGDGYYERNQNKFRDFRIVKGLRKPAKNTLIERRNRRIDTRGEATGLTVAQFKARRGKDFFRL